MTHVISSVDYSIHRLRSLSPFLIKIRDLESKYVNCGNATCERVGGWRGLEILVS